MTEPESEKTPKKQGSLSDYPEEPMEVLARVLEANPESEVQDWRYHKKMKTLFVQMADKASN